MNANSRMSGTRIGTHSPIQRTKHPANLIIQRGYGHRPAIDKLQEENKQLRRRLADLDIRMQLASNNPGSALYPTVAEYLFIQTEFQKLWDQYEAADDTQKATIEKQLDTLRHDVTAAHDAMIENMKEFVQRRIKIGMAPVPMLTVQA